MIRALTSFALLLLSVPVGAQTNFVLKDDPFDSCSSISNNASPRMTVYKCRGEGNPESVSVLATFRLGTSSLAPSRFMLKGGVELEQLDRPYATLTGCSGYGSCNYISTATFYIPLDLLFSSEVSNQGLEIKVFGMVREEMIFISPQEIAALREAMIRHSFTER